MRGLTRLSEEQVAALESHYALLVRWNQAMNLTTVIDVGEASVRHYAESLFLGLQIHGDSVVDVGSGAGFPGIPIAVLRPEWMVTLVESNRRKASFLREAARDLPNIRVIAERAEDVQQRFDWLVSRAVDPEEVSSLALGTRQALLLGGEHAKRFPTAEVRALPWGRNRVVVITGPCFT